MDVVGDLSWVEAFDGCGGQPELEDKEKIDFGEGWAN